MGELGKGLNRKEVGRLMNGVTRRGFMGGGAGLAALAAFAGLRPGVTSAEALNNLGILPDDLPAKKYRMATVEVGAASTWVSHGIETSKFFGSLLGVEVQEFDGQFSVENQLKALQDISTGQWDWVAVHPSASDALVDGANAVIEKGIPLVIMDTRLIQDPDQFSQYGHLTFLEPDNIYMGSTVAQELFKAIGGEGEVIHTQGQLAHTGAQGRAEGFRQTVANYPNIKVVDETPGDWQVEKVASLWQDLLQRFPNVKGGFFHNDDMALAARSVVEAAGMSDQVKIVGVDGLKNACEAILEDKLTASVINPSGRIHGGSVWAGYLTASKTDNAEGGLPKFIRTDGGPITKSNAAGYIWLHDNFQY
ncbi:MAG: ribose transport system substrate-binding protein [Thermomicrobiales bacterium]|jgi:ribose transport system substrate-binding protein|nr:ribose transport system substrate-binding protein [Thermomicrobiales bacterium]MEA2596334.1 ribose transport system substrate-binding protein [Thermomicrobiales bacterium]